MKTPREVLLNRHQAAEPRLDQIRRGVVAGLRRQETKSRETPLLIAAAFKLWRELIVPARVTWAGIAALWLVIGVINLTQADETTASASVSSASPQELRAAWERHRELLLELALLPTVDAAIPPKLNPQPRSDRQSESACA
jgi:hypothetical protein